MFGSQTCHVWTLFSRFVFTFYGGPKVSRQPQFDCERFEPRSHFKSRLSLIVRVNVVLNRTVVVVDSDWRFDKLCGSHLQSQSELYHVSWWYYTLVIDLIGQLLRDVIGRLSIWLAAISICSRQFQFCSQQFQFIHGNLNFVHGNFNLLTAFSILLTAAITHFSLRSPLVSYGCQQTRN